MGEVWHLAQELEQRPGASKSRVTGTPQCALFFGTPFVIGAFTAWLYNARVQASLRNTQQVVLMTIGVVGGITQTTAAEGALCLFIATRQGSAA